MVTPSPRKYWMLLPMLIIFLIFFPNLTYSKSVKTPKSIKISQKTRHIEKTKIPQKSISPTSPEGFQYDAQSAVLMDALTGKVLYEQNPNLRIAPASFVKVMTLYLIFDALRDGRLKMEEMVTVSEKAWRMEGSKMFIKVGERVKVEDLIKGVAVASGNDACVALAEYLSGSEEVFVSKMNEKAKEIGLKDTQFRNAHGLPAEGQYTTAMDMALLANRYIEDHPEALAFHSTVEFEYNGIRQGNRNTLLQKNIGVDGLKTGHVEESGYHLVATAKRDGQRLIAVVMGCDKVSKRAPETQRLLEYGFKNFSTIEAIKKGSTFGPIQVKRGKLREVMLIAEDSGWVTVAKGKEGSITVLPQLPQFIEAPIQKGQIVSKVLIQNEGKVVKEINLIASSAVEKTIIPAWPVLIGIILGIAIIFLIGLLWMSRGKRKKLK